MINLFRAAIAIAAILALLIVGPVLLFRLIEFLNHAGFTVPR